MSKDLIQRKDAPASLDTHVLDKSGFEDTNTSAEAPAMQLKAEGSDSPMQLKESSGGGVDGLMQGFAQTTGHDLSNTSIEFNSSEPASHGAIATHQPGVIKTSESQSESLSKGTLAHELGHEADVRSNGTPQVTGQTPSGAAMSDSREGVADNLGEKAAAASK